MSTIKRLQPEARLSGAVIHQTDIAFPRQSPGASSTHTDNHRIELLNQLGVRT